MTFLVTPFSLK